MRGGRRLRAAGGFARLALIGRRWRVPCLTSPAVPSALVLAAGILAGAACGDGPAAALWPGTAWVALGVGITLAVSPWRAWRLALLPVGVALARLHQEAPWDTLSRHLPKPACRVTVQAVVTDALCIGEALDLLPPPPSVVVSVRGLQLPGQLQWHPAGGKALLLLPETCRLTYGDRIHAEGFLMPLEPAAFPQAFDFRSYLSRNGIRHTMQVERLRPDGIAGGLTGVVRRLLVCRDLMAAGLVAHVPTADDAGILLAMTFGFRQTLRADTRDAFLRSGAIHVFSVSGLHVVIVATVLGVALLLTGMPYRWRYAGLPLLLGVYVLMTGCAASAVRAWLMVSLVCLARARFLAFSPINGVALAAVVLLAWNPLMIFQAGFLYSFATVSALVLGWPLVTELSRDLTERGLWLPRALRPRRRLRATRAAVRALGSSLLAWFGGAGLMAYLSALVVPAALPVNLVLVLVANLLLVLAIPKMILACLPVALPDIALGHLMGGAVEVIEVLVRLGSEPAGSWAVPVPPLAVVVLYHAAFFSAFLPRLPGSWRLGAFGLALAALAAATWFPWRQPCTVVVWGGDCDVPVTVMERDDGLPPVVVHSGTAEAHRVLANWLQRRGFRRVDAIVFASDSRRAAETAPLAVRLLQPATLILTAEPRPGSSLYRAWQGQQGRGGRRRVLVPGPEAEGVLRTTWPGGAVTLLAAEGGRRLEVTTRGAEPGRSQTLTIERLESGRCRVRLARPGTPPDTIELIPSFHRRVIPVGRTSCPALAPIARL